MTHFEPHPKPDPLERMFAEMERSGEIRRLSDGTAQVVRATARVPKSSSRVDGPQNYTKRTRGPEIGRKTELGNT
jgi:hypothetical protein